VTLSLKKQQINNIFAGGSCWCMEINKTGLQTLEVAEAGTTSLAI
jgi:hypothetical protein